MMTSLLSDDTALFSSRYGATLSYLRHKISKISGSTGVIFTPNTYPDVATAILACPCNSYMVDIEPDSELPHADQVAELLDTVEDDHIILVVSQVAPQFLRKKLIDLEDKFEVLYVSNDLWRLGAKGINSLSPVATGAVYSGDLATAGALRYNSTNPVGGDYTAITPEQLDIVTCAGSVAEARAAVAKAVQSAKEAGLSPLSLHSSTLTFAISEALQRIETLRAAGYSVGSPVTPLHRLLQTVVPEDYPNAECFVQNHLSISSDVDDQELSEVLQALIEPTEVT